MMSGTPYLANMAFRPFITLAEVVLLRFSTSMKLLVTYYQQGAPLQFTQVYSNLIPRSCFKVVLLQWLSVLFWSVR